MQANPEYWFKLFTNLIRYCVNFIYTMLILTFQVYFEKGEWKLVCLEKTRCLQPSCQQTSANQDCGLLWGRVFVQSHFKWFIKKLKEHSLVFRTNWGKATINWILSLPLSIFVWVVYAIIIMFSISSHHFALI